MKSTSHAETLSSSVSTSVTPLSEVERVFCWRIVMLAEAGYPDDATVVLAASTEVDLHHAVDLLGSGCPVDTALRILL